MAATVVAEVELDLTGEWTMDSRAPPELRPPRQR
jgi:hypothetical protein